MTPRSLVAEIFGYLVCLIAVIVFFCSVAGLVSSAFGIVSPTVDSHVMQHAIQAPPAFGMPGIREHLIPDARENATRRFAVSVVMLIVSIVVFRRTFDWLNARETTSTL